MPEGQGREPPELRQVYSSFVDAIGYDEEARELHVVYSRGRNAGQRVVYRGVEPDVAAQVGSAPSIGEALHALVRAAKGQPPRYPHQ